MTTPDHRYHIGCAICGLISTWAHKEDAFSEAQQLRSFSHTSDAEYVTVFDSMAHVGQPMLWNCWGDVLKRKEVRR